MEHIKYESIERLKETNQDYFKYGDEIVIQEKIDGANASFEYDEETDTIFAFSRNKILDETNDLRGFYQWTQKLNKKVLRRYPNLRFFGEWLVSHTVVYPQECYSEFYLFDVLETKRNIFENPLSVDRFASEVGLDKPTIFYKGEFQSWEHCQSFVGKTALGGEYGEGIVIKKSEQAEVQNHIKIIYDRFNEVKVTKKNKEVSQELLENIAIYVNRNRFEKQIHKLIDKHLLKEDWNEKDFNFLSQVLPSIVFTDILLEEDVDFNLKIFYSLINKKCMPFVKQIYLDR